MEGDYVLVIGSSVLEIAGRPIEVPRPGMRQQAHIHASVSGVARNIAENLARLDIDTVLLSAVADDELSQFLLTHSARAGIDCRHVLRVNGERTATSLLLYQGEDSLTRLDDLSIARALGLGLSAGARAALCGSGAGGHRCDAAGRRAGHAL